MGAPGAGTRGLDAAPGHGESTAADDYKQHLDNVRRKDPLRGAETTEIFVRLGNYSASHLEGSAYNLFPIKSNESGPYSEARRYHVTGMCDNFPEKEGSTGENMVRKSL